MFTNRGWYYHDNERLESLGRVSTCLNLCLRSWMLCQSEVAEPNHNSVGDSSQGACMDSTEQQRVCHFLDQAYMPCIREQIDPSETNRLCHCVARSSRGSVAQPCTLTKKSWTDCTVSSTEIEYNSLTARVSLLRRDTFGRLCQRTALQPLPEERCLQRCRQRCMNRIPLMIWEIFALIILVRCHRVHSCTFHCYLSDVMSDA